MTETVWLDCDPGTDDAFAIIMAAYSKNINLIGVSTVAGNQILEKTTNNALNVLNIIGCLKDNQLSFPLLQGHHRPLLRRPIVCEEIFGESGLEFYSPDRKFPALPQAVVDQVNELNSTDSSVHFTARLFEYLKSANTPVTVIATGPLTNIALLLINYPRVTKYIKKLVLMGGACGLGNVAPVSEFNIHVDPEAAHIVFETESLEIYMVPLDVTNTALVTNDIMNSIRDIRTNFSSFLVDLLLFIKHRMDHFTGGLWPETPLHDPCAIAFVVDPSIFEFRLLRVDVEMASPISFGQTVCDMYNCTSKRKNVHVCIKMNVAKFWQMMLHSVKQADTKSPVNA